MRYIVIEQGTYYSMKKQKYKVVLTKEDDMYVAECPKVGTVSQGATINEALNNIQEATQLYVGEFCSERQS